MAASPVTSGGEKHEDDVSVQEIIFSCGICLATVSEIYANPEDNKGFTSDPGHDHGIITKLWIGDCSHIFCGSHLKGGGQYFSLLSIHSVLTFAAAPFHPKGMAPRAACPVCIQEHGDESMRELFGIRGMEDGQYDEVIPQDYFKCPPRRLDAQDPHMDALRVGSSGKSLRGGDIANDNALVPI